MSASDWKLDDLLRAYRPGSGDWTWREEFADVWTSHPQLMTALLVSVAKCGMRDPIMLGDDGRIWDGHHRIAVAHALMLDRVPTVQSVEAES